MFILLGSMRTSTAVGLKSKPKSTVLPQPALLASAVLGSIRSGASMPRTSKGSGSIVATGTGSWDTCSTTSVTSIVRDFLW